MMAHEVKEAVEQAHSAELMRLCGEIGSVQGFRWYVFIHSVHGWLILCPLYSDEGVLEHILLQEQQQ